MSKSILYLGNQLSKKGKTPTSVETLGRFLENEGFTVFKASSKQNQLHRLLDMWKSIIRLQKKIDVVFIDTYSTLGFWFSYSCGLLCQFLNLSYVPILRGGDLPKRLAKNPKLCHQLFNNAKINVAPSGYLMHHFEQAGYTNLVFIPNTIALNHYDFKQRERLKPNLLWVRSFAEIYHPLLALKVLKALLKRFPDAKLSMVGPFKDDSIQTCRAYAEKHNLPVTFTGGMPKADWLAYAQDFDVFINTTNVDNTPVSVIEAMALGLPVVSTNVGGLPFLLKDQKDALLVPPDHPEAMCEAIKQLLKKPELTHLLSRQGRQKVEAFDWQVVKQQWFEVISES
ncbi:Glycosyltransferase involved in cell wall bisynthesis [Psychroflexus salarius]|uniref:Glycosyltransferase involved in cell wall bisynthesis n=1 Tax=Psychroflexus salarius TaxID=1155689 RepID=A0A1M4X2H7_9FLAO|nr:glycosyltransferase [Psychroflexus salarius]SHE87704.1 Glycosyltransferase involved in cell wall bisynthesis [Psychroflexus salarius]